MVQPSVAGPSVAGLSQLYSADPWGAGPQLEKKVPLPAKEKCLCVCAHLCSSVALAPSYNPWCGTHSRAVQGDGTRRAGGPAAAGVAPWHAQTPPLGLRCGVRRDRDAAAAPLVDGPLRGAQPRLAGSGGLRRRANMYWRISEHPQCVVVVFKSWNMGACVFPKHPPQQICNGLLDPPLNSFRESFTEGIQNSKQKESAVLRCMPSLCY